MLISRTINLTEIGLLSFKTGLISSTVCLDYAYCKVNYKLIAIDLSKQKALDADKKQFSK